MNWADLNVRDVRWSLAASGSPDPDCPGHPRTRPGHPRRPVTSRNVAVTRRHRTRDAHAASWLRSPPLAAFRPDVLTALARITVDAIFASYRARAKRAGVLGAQCGAINFVQRFGGSLNLHVHFHVVVVDGTFTRRREDGVVFHAAPRPSRADLEGIVERVRRRATRWLRRRGYVDGRPAEERSNEPPAQTAMGSCAAIAMGRGRVAMLSEQRDSSADDAPRRDLPVRHWERLLAGVLYAVTSRLDWASLLRRSFDVDVLQCPTCAGRLRVLAVITERDAVQEILASLGMDAEAPPLSRARDPTEDLADEEPPGQLELALG